MSKKVGQIEYFVPKRNQNAKIYEGIFKEIAIEKLQIKVRIVENVTEEDVQKLVNLESHPNIQRIFGYEYKDSVFYIGLWSFDVTLNDFIKIKQNKRPKINNILLIKNITDGLKFLHDNGIVHDNISFKNVGISYEQNIALLCNYGFDDLQEEDFFVTPEHASFDFQKSYPADVFNLGIVIFFILTNGRHPFGELNDSQSIINNIFNTQFKCKSRDFKFLKNEAHKIACAISLLNKMLKRKPEDRIICSEIVNDPLCWDNREIYRFFREVNQSWKDYSSEDKTTINNKWTFIKNKYLEVNDERNLTNLVDDMVQKVRHFEESLFIDELRDEHILTYMEEFPLLLSFVYDLTSNTLQNVEEIEELTNEFSSAMNINSEDIQTTNSFNKNIYTGRFNNIDVSVRKIPKENSKDFDVELKNIKKLADRKKLGLECKSCKKVKCENVLKFFGYYDEPKFFCIVLEKIENDFKSFLSILMNDNKKNIPKVTKIMFDVVKGLECLHANSIAHLNLNSHSLMIVVRNDVQIGCLANFGRVEEVIIAKESQGEKFNDMYIAPELKKKRKEGTKTDYSKCDIYSLGILFKTEYLSFLLNLNNPKTHDKEDLRKLRKEDKISFLFEELVNFATEETPLKRPNAEGVRKNPFFWDSDFKIQFLRDVTECYEGIKVKTKIIDKIEERALKKLFVVDIQQSIENSNSLDENKKNQTGGWMDFLDVDEEVLKEISKFIGRENRKNSKIALKKEKSIFTLIKLIISIYDSEGSDDFKTSRILLNAANPEEYLNYWLKKFELIGFLYYVMEEHMNKMYPTFYSTQTPKRILGNRRMSSVLVERPSLRRNLCEGGDNLESF